MHAMRSTQPRCAVKDRAGNEATGHCCHRQKDLAFDVNFTLCFYRHKPKMLTRGPRRGVPLRWVPFKSQKISEISEKHRSLIGLGDLRDADRGPRGGTPRPTAPRGGAGRQTRPTRLRRPFRRSSWRPWGGHRSPDLCNTMCIHMYMYIYIYIHIYI